ncbi:MAG: hypothetical protein ABR973_13745 [Candidatus Acidiferrales bacterium]|jgi:rubrerythrin
MKSRLAELTASSSANAIETAAAHFEEIRHDEMGHRDVFKIVLIELES